jgi:cytochrome o ubiquinol oxidase subunit 3
MTGATTGAKPGATLRGAELRAAVAENPMAGLGTATSHRVHSERALGFWVYLMSDAIIFAVLFSNYGVLTFGVADGPTAHELFSLSRAAQETALLLLSSLTFGLVSYSALSGQKGRAMFWLIVTMVLGAGFLALELSEFREMFARGAGPQASGFLSGFFALVGTHGLHVAVGMIMMAVMGVQFVVKGLTEPVLSRLYRVGLFWHFLDLVWIGIFSFVYLPGVLS